MEKYCLSYDDGCFCKKINCRRRRSNGLIQNDKYLYIVIMKKVSTVIGFFVLCFGFSALYSAKQPILLFPDGVDKRVLLVTDYLRKVMPKKSFLALSFSEAVCHIKEEDTSSFYMKIPFVNKKLPGFVLVKKKGNQLQYAGISIEQYRFKDSTLLKSTNSSIRVVIRSANQWLNKDFVMQRNGKTKNMQLHLSRYTVQADTVFKNIPFLLYGYFKTDSRHPGNSPVTPDLFEAYLNTNFIFDQVDSLLYHQRHTPVLVHDMIPLGFSPMPSFTFEFSNADILPAVDIHKLLGTGQLRKDSLRKQFP